MRIVVQERSYREVEGNGAKPGDRAKLGTSMGTRFAAGTCTVAKYHGGISSAKRHKHPFLFYISIFEGANL